MTTQSTDNCGRPQWMERRWLSKYQCQTKRLLKCSWYWDLFIKDTKNERTASTGGCNERERENFKSSDDSDYFIYHHKFNHALFCNGWTGGPSGYEDIFRAAKVFGSPRAGRQASGGCGRDRDAGSG